MGLGINGFVGGNMMKQTNESQYLYGSEFAIPFFHSLSNTVNPSRSTGYTELGINSAYYSAEFSFKSILPDNYRPSGLVFSSGRKVNILSFSEFEWCVIRFI